MDQAGFVRLDAAILGDFALDGLGRVLTSLRFACVRSTAGARGPRDILCFRVMAVSSEGAVVGIEDVRMDGPPDDERRSLLSNGLSPHRDDLKASVATALAILLARRAAFFRA